MRPPATLLRVLLTPGLLCLGTALFAWSIHLERVAASPLPLSPIPHFSPLAPGGIDPQLLADVALPVELTLKRGETLESVLLASGLPRGEAHAAIEVAAQHLDPRRLRAGDSYSVLYTGGRSLTGFAFALDQGRVVLDIDDGQWRSRFLPYHRTLEEILIDGALTGSLESSLEAAGGHASLAYAMEDVLQWDLDFNRDLREGDRFRVLYRVTAIEGEGARVQEILALQYENRGLLREAYRFDDGYYDSAGRPLRKQFLRSPLQYSSRITSRFSHRRFHPILKVNRPHYGVDYGAPTGTPVRTTANGTVTFAGWDGGGGKTVKVRHPNGYVTAYLHLSGYAKGIRPGVRVEQGQVVGYVGATGLATASHVDYRVQHNGKWVDPLSLRSEPAPSIPEAELARFYVDRDAYRRRLVAVGGESTIVARVGEGPSSATAGR